jgi:putative SOS response-associated peptidase YedK
MYLVQGQGQTHRQPVYQCPGGNRGGKTQFSQCVQISPLSDPGGRILRVQGTKGNKQPVFITLPDKSPFAFAGLWENWRDKANDNDSYRSCTIITTQASASIRKLHHRMPIVLHPDIYGAWLDPSNQKPEQLLGILSEKIHRDFIYHPVSKQVNSVLNNAPSNIEPMTQATFDFET